MADACENCVVGGYLTHPPWLTLWAKFWDFGSGSIFVVGIFRAACTSLDGRLSCNTCTAGSTFCFQTFSRSSHFYAIMWHRPDKNIGCELPVGVVTAIPITAYCYTFPLDWLIITYVLPYLLDFQFVDGDGKD